MTTWKELDELHERVGKVYMARGNKRSEDIPAPIAVNEALRLLTEVRQYKEMLREFYRFFKTHKVKNLSDLAKRLAEVEKSG